MAFRRVVLVVALSFGMAVPDSAGIGTTPREAAQKRESARVERALSRAAECLLRDRDGPGFRDPYLTYVYPGEDLPSPPDTPPLTYRNVDAASILVSIGRGLVTGGGPAGRKPDDGVSDQASPPTARLMLATMIGEAEASIAGAAATWRGRGFSNVSEGARPGGVALDTFCTVGWLERDAGMAEEAAAAIHGDGWLPGALYDAGDEFRLLADESWCLRLLAATGKFGRTARRVFEHHAAVFRDHARKRPEGMGTYYEALHLGMVLAEFNRESGRGAVAPSSESADETLILDEVVAALRSWAATHAPGGRADPGDVLEWANLASADVLGIPSVAARDDLRGRAVRIVLDLQQGDGCWVTPGARPPRAGATFLTLRAVLALTQWSETHAHR